MVLPVAVGTLPAIGQPTAVSTSAGMAREQQREGHNRHYHEANLVKASIVLLIVGYYVHSYPRRPHQKRGRSVSSCSPHSRAASDARPGTGSAATLALTAPMAARLAAVNLIGLAARQCKAPGRPRRLRRTRPDDAGLAYPFNGAASGFAFWTSCCNDRTCEISSSQRCRFSDERCSHQPGKSLSSAMFSSTAASAASARIRSKSFIRPSLPVLTLIIVSRRERVGITL